MKLRKFNELPFFLENYIIDIESSDVISKNKNVSVVKQTQRGYKVCKLYRNGVCSVYTLANLLAYKVGILNKDNYNLNVKLEKDNDYSINSLKPVTISEQNKISGVGDNLTEFWRENGYKNRDREYTYKYSYLTRNKIYRYKVVNKFTNAEISRKLNIPKCTIGRILKDFSPCPVEESGIASWVDKHLSEVDKEMILSLYKSRAKINDICNMYKVPQKIVKRIGEGELW